MNEDYIDEKTGLRYCGKCHTPKEIRLPGGAELFGTRKFRIPCKCQQEAWNREEQERRQREFRERVHVLRREAFREIPGQNWRFDSVKSDRRLDKLKLYADHWEEMRRDGMGLLLFGGVGTGKSYAAGCLANALLDQGQSVRFVGLSDVVNRMQGCFGSDREKYLRDLLGPELLILDDLGSERSTNFGKEQVFDVVNKRTLSGKPLVITTNIPLKVMQQAEDIQDRRIFDRILEKCVPIAFTGENFRETNAAENFKRAAAILNSPV